jgi:hypothetical protein
MSDEIDKLAVMAEETIAAARREFLAAAEDWRDSELLSSKSFGVIMNVLIARDSPFIRRACQLSNAHSALHDGTDVNDYLGSWRDELRALLRADIETIVEEAGGL